MVFNALWRGFKICEKSANWVPFRSYLHRAIAIASSSSRSLPEYDVKPSAQLISGKPHDLVEGVLKQRLAGHRQLGGEISRDKKRYILHLVITSESLSSNLKSDLYMRGEGVRLTKISEL